MDTLIRLGFFVAILLVIIAWEYYAPRRALRYSRWRRWPVNMSLSIITTILLRVSIGGIAYFSAITLAELEYGLLNWLALPAGLSVIIALVLFDLAIYGQHRLMHQWSVLWRLHKVHHTDLDFDVTTAIRFHPIEIFVSLFYKVLVIALLGAPALAVLIFEIILSSSALFNHGNIQIPLVWDRRLRWVFVTPDMHRIHHSSSRQETDSNFGFSISIWDRLFGTYTAEPELGHANMIIGLEAYRYSHTVSLRSLLSMPFKSPR